MAPTWTFLTHGYQICPPSSTYLFSDERGRGGPYQWIEGHSPFDITSTELEPPPELVLEFWHECADKQERPGVSSDDADTSAPKAWRLITGAIPQGQRNDSLARIAGWLRLYHPVPIVEELLLLTNDARCDPPLPEHEVRGIAQSIGRYPMTSGAVGHPLGVVPSFVRET